MAESPQPQPRPFAYLDTPHAALYRRVLRAFVAAKRHFLVHLRPEDVLGALHADGPAVEAALAKLATREWGNLRADPDTSRVTTVEDFYRPRYLYQLTREGEAAELALDAYDEALGRRGELQSVALEDIRVRLGNLRGQAASPSPDAAVVHSLLRELSALLDGLAANASAFMSGLQRTIDLHDVNEDAFVAYKDKLIGYLERFIGDLVVKSAEIVRSLEALEQAGVERLLELAASREAADAAPDREEAAAGGANPVERRLAEWQSRWSGLHSWFVGDRTRPSQASLLRQRARAAIPALLAAVTALHERRAGRSDRSADFRTLARWFAEAPSDADAHRLWRAAFALSSSRHLTVDAETVQAREDQPLPASTGWAAAPPVVVSPRLRATGRHQRRGGPQRIVDRSAERRLLAERLEAERTQTEAARRRLATGRRTRLRDLGNLDRDEFELFLRLLGEALAAAPPGARAATTTTTTDGTLAIELLPAGDGAVAEVVTPDGVFRGPDHFITITDLMTAPARPRVPPMAPALGGRR